MSAKFERSNRKNKGNQHLHRLQLYIKSSTPQKDPPGELRFVKLLSRITKTKSIPTKEIALVHGSFIPATRLTMMHLEAELNTKKMVGVPHQS